MELIIDGFAISWQKIETGILQGLPIFPILFLIYISKVFPAIGTKLPNITCISFINDLAYVTSDYSINKVGKVLKEEVKIAF